MTQANGKIFRIDTKAIEWKKYKFIILFRYEREMRDEYNRESLYKDFNDAFLCYLYIC